MIGPVNEFAKLNLPVPDIDDEGRVTRPAGMAPIETRAQLDAEAERIAAVVGIEFQEMELRGRNLILFIDGREHIVHRRKYYALVEPHDVLAAVAAFVQRVRDDYGAGRAWTLSGRVGVVTDEGLWRTADVDGRTYVLMRMYVGHEKDARPF